MEYSGKLSFAINAWHRKLIKNFCKACKGKGIIEKNKDVKVRVPPGADTGNAIRLEGEGETGRHRTVISM